MFDPSAPHIIILLVVVLLLFGSTRLPGAARALGQSMHIFRKSVKGLDEDKPGDGNPATTVVSSPPAQLEKAQADQTQQAQLDALQRQLNDLQRRSPAGDGQGNDQQRRSPAGDRQGNVSAPAEQPKTRSY